MSHFGPTHPRGRRGWKFNTQLLKNESLCAVVNSFWASWQPNKPAFTNPQVWWDAEKLQSKEIAITHSVTEARERKRDKLTLENEFRNILARGTSNTVDDHVRLAEIRDLLNAIEDHNVKGAIIRSREQWLEFGEKPTNYFYQLEKQRQTHNSINELRVGDQTVTSQKYFDSFPRFLCELIHCRTSRFKMPRLAFKSTGYSSEIRRSGEM